MLSSEPSVSSNLFRGGGNEIFQELPKCDTDMLLSKYCWKNGTDKTCSTQCCHRPSICKKCNLCEAQYNEVCIQLNNKKTNNPI